MPSTQKPLLKQLKALHLKSSDGGMCYGITCMALQALLAGDIASFDERINLLLNYPSAQQLASDIKDVKKKVREHEKINPAEEKLLDAVAFLEGIDLYFQPKQFADFLNDDADLTQEFLNVFTMLYPEKMQHEKDNVHVLKQFTNIYNQKNLGKFLTELESINKHESFPAPIMIRANSHAISIWFDKNKGWILIDPNKLPSITIRDTKKLAKQIITCFHFGNVKPTELCMNIDIYSASRAQSKYAQKLQALEDQQIEQISTAKIKQTFDEVSPPYNSLLDLAARNSNDTVIEKILKKGATQSNIESSICISIESDKSSAFNILMSHTADTPTKLGKWLQLAFTKNSLKIIKTLLSSNPTLADTTFTDYRNPSPIFLAIDYNHRRLTKLLLNHDFDIEKKDSLDNTPILRAAARGNFEIVKFLIENKNANTAVTNCHGHNLLAEAVLSKNRELVDYIINKTNPSNLNPCDATGYSLIYKLITHPLRHSRNWKMAEWLISKGAMISEKEIKHMLTMSYPRIKKEDAEKIGCLKFAALLSTVATTKPLQQHSVFTHNAKMVKESSIKQKTLTVSKDSKHTSKKR